MSGSTVMNDVLPYHLIFDNMVNGFAYHKIITDNEGKPVDYELLAVNKAFEEFTGLQREDILGRRVTEIFPGIEDMEFQWIKVYGKVALEGEPIAFEQYFDPQQEWYFISAYCPKKGFFAVNFDNITASKKAKEEKEKLEYQIQQSSKMQAVGTLAAGIAHEINTPIQFLGTNIDFMNEATKEFCSLVNQIQLIVANAPHEIRAQINNTLEEADWEYLVTEMPEAISQSQVGIKRVASIVQAMKNFSHPGNREKLLCDLNQIIKTAVTVSTNEWNFIAEMDLDLDSDLPKIPLLVDDVGQVFLNILINAVHAIENRFIDNSGEKQGKIKISSAQDGGSVEVRICDNGTGVPKAIKNQIFTPFFTTKEVGQGTGQGLSVVYSIVVDKHNGTVDCQSEEGIGTTVILRLPMTA